MRSLNSQPLVHIAPGDLAKTSGEADRFSTPSVSRATHFPASRMAAGLLAWLTPAPWPSLQLQSLPKSSLS
jgi:hypothetical protein